MTKRKTKQKRKTRKKPGPGKICLVKTFANVDTHVKLIEKVIIPKDSFTDGFVWWKATPMYDLDDDHVYMAEKKALRDGGVPVDTNKKDEYCTVFHDQIIKVI